MQRLCNAQGILASLTVLFAAPLFAQESVQKRLDKLERENRELRASFGKEIERMQFGSFIPALGESKYGMGPAASKVYNQDEGLSIGGYGEYLYRQRSGNTDVYDALRTILYTGYRFEQNWVFNSEIEFEHGTTSATSGTSSSGGSASVEFGYLEYLHSESLNFRAGLLLVPMGLINEMHEPTTFLAGSRPVTEQRILPSTWRENGIGLHGKVGKLEYSAYTITSLNGENFSRKGVRSGRQKGNKAAADDMAFVGRLDWEASENLTIGGSFFYGDTGQDGFNNADPKKVVPSMHTNIYELHAEFQSGGFQARALYAAADIDDSDAFNTNTGANLAEGMVGYYAELGYDMMTSAKYGRSDETWAMIPFVRWENIDTQKDMAAGYTADASQEDTILTFGLHYRPIEKIVIKADFQSYDKGDDQFEILFGYIF